MQIIIKNEDRVNNFIKKINKDVSIKTSKWINSNIKSYLVNTYQNVKIVSETKSSKTMHIVLGKELKVQVRNVIEFLENENTQTYFNSDNFDFDELLRLSNFKNLVMPLSNDYYLIKVDRNIMNEPKYKDFNIENYSHSISKNIWAIVDKNNNILSFIPYTTRKSWSNYSVLCIDKVFYKNFNRLSLRLFFEFIQKNFKENNIYDDIFNYNLLNKVDNKFLPLSLWDDGGILNKHLQLDTRKSFEFPKNLTINGDLIIQNSGVSYLGFGLNIKGDILATDSQLAVIDDSVKVTGKVYSENSLLVSFSNYIRKKIVNPQKLLQVVTDF